MRWNAVSSETSHVDVGELVGWMNIGVGWD
jgi:hypothetical protein